MPSRYLELMRSQRGQPPTWQWTGKRILSAIGLVSILASGVFWTRVQMQLTTDLIIALSTTAGLVLAPPALWAFILPFSPGGMLLQKIQSRTWGYLAIVAMALFYAYYSFQVLWSWWAAQPVVAASNLTYQQVLLCMILFIFVPALTWSAVDGDELVEQVRQAHLVQKYRLQSQADIAILRATLLRAQEKALLGFANLTLEEREELAGVMRGLVSGIDRTLQEIGASVKTVSGAMIPFASLDDNDEVRDVLDYISDSLVDSALAETGETKPNTLAPNALAYRYNGEQRHAPLTHVTERRNGGVIVHVKGGNRLVQASDVLDRYFEPRFAENGA